MYEIDKEKFGTFLSQLRREKGMTQKDLAEKLFVSDKAVSKWERGLSLPDVALLQPLADLMGVTISELLSGQRIREEAPLTAREADRLVSGALRLTAQEQEDRRESRRRWGMWYALGVVFLVLELACVWWRDWMLYDDMAAMMLVAPALAAIFGVHFCFFARERLPVFYDENKINFYSDGAFRMNVPGVHFNNSNWPHILRAMRVWLLGAMVLFPLLWGALAALWPGQLSAVRLALVLVFCLGLFVPAMLAARRHA